MERVSFIPKTVLMTDDRFRSLLKFDSVKTFLMRRWMVVLVAAFGGMAFISPVRAADPLPASHNRTTVFRNGEGGYPIYRIPTIIRTANGDLLAFCEARTGGDASIIDVVTRRSTDQGVTWGPLTVFASHKDYRHLFGDQPPEISVGNACPLVDRLDPDHPGRLHVMYTVENLWIFTRYSDDHGVTWSAARDITRDVRKENWGWYATGPCHAIQIMEGPHRGRLVMPADHRVNPTGGDKGPCGSQLILSDDHGRTWRLGLIDDNYVDLLESNETTVTELAGGRLYINTRDQNGKMPGTRGEAFSTDGGETFEPTGYLNLSAYRPAAEVLDPPVVQCSVMNLKRPDGSSVVLFSGPDDKGPSGGGRRDLRLRFSTDQARTWIDGRLLHTGPAAYSDLVEFPLDQDRVGVLFETGDPPGRGCNRIDFLSLPLSDAITPSP